MWNTPRQTLMVANSDGALAVTHHQPHTCCLGDLAIPCSFPVNCCREFTNEPS